MEILEYRDAAVQRDMDLIRQILLNIEANPRFDGVRARPIRGPEDLGIEGHSVEEVAYHVSLLMDAGFVRGKHVVMPIPAIEKVTWQGHEFIDNIRDVGIWEKTKARLHGLQSVALTIVASIAEAEIKKKLGLTS